MTASFIVSSPKSISAILRHKSSSNLQLDATTKQPKKPLTLQALEYSNQGYDANNNNKPLHTDACDTSASAYTNTRKPIDLSLLKSKASKTLIKPHRRTVFSDREVSFATDGYSINIIPSATPK